MKNFRNTAIVFFLSVFVVSTFAKSKTSCTYEQVEDNLIVGVESSNQGLRISAAYFLGEIKSEKSVIPLMKILKSSTIEKERIMAALSLSKINTTQGNFAVQRRATFDNSERVRRLCNIFNKEINKQNKSNAKVTVEPIELSYIQNYLDNF
ncbi:MAG: HEAT repeat domain-containing protein [Melioribacteraceae bacterium]